MQFQTFRRITRIVQRILIPFTQIPQMLTSPTLLYPLSRLSRRWSKILLNRNPLRCKSRSEEYKNHLTKQKPFQHPYLPIYFCLFLGGAPKAYGSSQARGRIKATATATWNLSRVCNLHHSSRQCWILNPPSEARD